jgi:hypothetical protein
MRLVGIALRRNDRLGHLDVRQVDRRHRDAGVVLSIVRWIRSRVRVVISWRLPTMMSNRASSADDLADRALADFAQRLLGLADLEQEPDRITQLVLHAERHFDQVDVGREHARLVLEAADLGDIDLGHLLERPPVEAEARLADIDEPAKPLHDTALGCADLESRHVHPAGDGEHAGERQHRAAALRVGATTTATTLRSAAGAALQQVLELALEILERLIDVLAFLAWALAPGVLVAARFVPCHIDRDPSVSWMVMHRDCKLDSARRRVEL